MHNLNSIMASFRGLPYPYQAILTWGLSLAFLAALWTILEGIASWIARRWAYRQVRMGKRA
jgi:hypothetical protein